MNKTQLKQDYFYCYNKNLQNYLKLKGIRYVVKARTLASKAIFTLYEQTDELTHAINEYKSIDKSY